MHLMPIWCVAFICTYLPWHVLIFILKSSFQLHLGFFSALFLFTALLWSYFRYMEHMEQLGPSRAHQELRFETFTSMHLPCAPQDFACDPQCQIWKLQTLQGLFLSRFELFIAIFFGGSRVPPFRPDTGEEDLTLAWCLPSRILRDIATRRPPARTDCWFWVFLVLLTMNSFFYPFFLVVCYYVWVVNCILGLGNILLVMDVDYNWYLVVIFILDWFYSHRFLLKFVYCLVSPWIRPNPVWHELSNDSQLIRNCLGWFGIRKYPRGTFRV
jgi:hypothetical protein